MTLIVVVGTEQYVAIASDRRISYQVGGSVARREDSGLKTFQFAGNLLMGYTGLAHPNGQSIEAWLADRAARQYPTSVFESIRRDVQVEFDRRGLHKLSHTFAGVGFSEVNKLATYSIVISNSIDESGEVDPGAVSEKFRILRTQLGNKRRLVGYYGFPVLTDEKATFVRSLRAAIRANAGNPLLLMHPMVDLIRTVSSRSGGYVGATVLFSSMPKSSVPVSTLDHIGTAWMIPLPNAPLPTDGTSQPFAITFTGADDMTGGVSTYIPAEFRPEFQTTSGEMKWQQNEEGRWVTDAGVSIRWTP